MGTAVILQHIMEEVFVGTQLGTRH